MKKLQEAHIVALFFLGALVLRLFFTDFTSILREDAFDYLLKAIEIGRGNWTPIYSHSYGLSILAAPFLGLPSIFENMILGKFINTIIGAAGIFPLYLLTKEISQNKYVLYTTLSLFTFSSSLILSSTTFLTEPLFTLLLLFALYFLAQEKNWYLSFVFAGLAYYVKPNGLFLLFVGVISLAFLLPKKEFWKNCLLGFLIFFLISAPFLIQRNQTFGSAFTYGENDKHFVSSYDEVWSLNIKTPTAKEYLQTATLAGVVDKFFLKGFIKTLAYFIYDLRNNAFTQTVSPILIIFILYAVLTEHKNKKLYPIYITLALFVAGLSLVFAIFGNQRHLYPLIPLVLILASIGLVKIQNKLLVGLTLLTYITSSLIYLGINQKKPEITMPDWAVYASTLKGKIAVEEGGDLIMMNLPDVSIAGTNHLNWYAPTSDLSVTRPGLFQNTETALIFFKQTEITHLILEKAETFEKKPYLKDFQKNNSEEIYEDEIVTIYKLKL